MDGVSVFLNEMHPNTCTPLPKTNSLVHIDPSDMSQYSKLMGQWCANLVLTLQPILLNHVV